MKEEPLFEIAYLEEAIEFLASLEDKVKSKITYNIGKSMYYIDKELFKKLENTEIWEFRTLYNKQAYRLFAFWDTEENKLVIATHGIIKLTSIHTSWARLSKKRAKPRNSAKNSLVN